ncbi:hypothetical protein IAD21_00335 [Abditibacteriota bacterium]|nr:hypothetical protein IAD21_00335 [Abditibacteriota bacterium]
MRVQSLYSARSAPNAAHFLREHVLKELPFPVQRIQSDRGLEFIGLEFQDALREQHIKFRPNRPRAPHLNGKVERSQRTDRMEFWATVDIKASREQLDEQLALWQSFYNGERTHSSLNSKTPNQRFHEVQQLVPTHQQVQQAYGPTPQPYVINRHYHWAMPESP